MSRVWLLLEPIPIISDEFRREIQKLESHRAKASRIEHAIDRTITIKLHEDPALYESMRERLERIIREREEQRIDDAEEFRLLLGLRDRMVIAASQEVAEPGMRADAAPFFGVIRSALSDAGRPLDQYRLSALAESVLDALNSETVIDWRQKENVQREMRRQVKKALRLDGIEGEVLEPLVTAIMDLARVRLPA